MLGIVRPWARICSIYHVSICISCVQVTASNNAIIPAQRNGIKNISCLEMFIEWRSAGQRGARGAASESNANISWGCRAQQSSPDLTPATISCHLVPSPSLPTAVNTEYLAPRASPMYENGRICGRERARGQLLRQSKLTKMTTLRFRIYLI